jgi:Iodothyronine deiodinase/EF hand
MTDRDSTSALAAARAAGTGPGLRLIPALAFVIAALALARPAWAQTSARDPGRDRPRLTAFRDIPGQVGDLLIGTVRRAWPDPPQAVAMFLDILQGSQLGPGDGWFKTALAQTRYDWNATRKRLDCNGDGRVSHSEYPGCDADFTRLDRNHDGSLSQPDFDFSPHALVPSTGSAFFYRADADSNGKLTLEELAGFFRANDSDGAGFLSLADLQEAFSRPPSGKSSSTSSHGPSRLTLIKGLLHQEIGSLQPGPALGAVAPDFTLKTALGDRNITLSKQIGPRPVILVFGNFTCGPFRVQAGNVEKLFRRYRERATFVMIYVREAHPTEGWQLESNIRLGVAESQPQSDDERVKVAQTCSRRLGLGMPMLVDAINDAVGARYSGMPSRLYLLDRQGRVAYKSGRGPFGFKPAELEHSLILLLQDEFPQL